MEESKLIQRARKGDQAAWIDLVADHQQALFRLAYLILGDPQEAQDVTQEVFIQAYRHLSGFKEGYTLRPWLLRITANLARNRQRSLGRYWAALTRFRRNQDEASSNTPEKITARKNQSELLWQAIRQLRPSDQEIIYLRYFLELPVSETAQVLNVSPGTVKSRLHRSLQRLESTIKKDFPNLREDTP